MIKIIQIKSKECIIDDSCFDMISLYKWSLDKDGYAVSRRNKKTIRMHRLITNAKKGQEVDHVNRNKLDNRQSNLRFLSHHENTLNRKRGIGVAWKNDKNKWRARIKFKNKEIHLGYFNKKDEALEARKNACLKYFGKYAFIS